MHHEASNFLNFKLQVPLPEKPETEDESILKKWKWEMKSAKKENSERHSLRCDIELKLSVSFLPLPLASK